MPRRNLSLTSYEERWIQADVAREGKEGSLVAPMAIRGFGF
jgi:hypothetical protein